MKELKPLLKVISDVGHAIEVQASKSIHLSNEEKIDSIVNIHTEITGAVDWITIASEPAPIEPTLKRTNYEEALKQFKQYKPKFYHLPGQFIKKKNNLKELGKVALKKETVNNSV